MHSPPKGSGARSRPAGHLSSPPPPRPAASPRPESPQPLTWPWQRARAEDRGWPSPGSGLVSPPPAGWRRRAPLARPRSSEELAPPLAGVCVRRASRPRAQVPGAERGGGRRGRRRIPQVRPLPLPRDLGGGGDPRAPPLRPASLPTALPGAPLPDPRGVQWGVGSRPPAPGESSRPGARASIPKLTRPPGGTCMSTAGSGGVSSGGGLSPTNAPGAADGLSREEKLFSRRFHLHS